MLFGRRSVVRGKNAIITSCANTPNNVREMRGLPFAGLCGTTPTQKLTIEKTQWRKVKQMQSVWNHANTKEG